jgi:uncharacterized protein YcgL (UPF0745 family)
MGEAMAERPKEIQMTKPAVFSLLESDTFLFIRMQFISVPNVLNKWFHIDDNLYFVLLKKTRRLKKADGFNVYLILVLPL